MDGKQACERMVLPLPPQSFSLCFTVKVPCLLMGQNSNENLEQQHLGPGFSSMSPAAGPQNQVHLTWSLV